MMKAKKATVLLMMFVIALLPIYRIGADECVFEFRQSSKVVTLCDKKYKIDVPPTDVDGNLYIPYRFVTERLGLDVKWNANERSVTAAGRGYNTKIWIDKNEFVSEENTFSHELTPIIKDSRTLVDSSLLNSMFDLDFEVDGRYATSTVDSDRIYYLWNDFTLPVDRGYDGEVVTLSDYLTNPEVKAVIVQIWYTYCIPCHAELDFLARLEKKYRDKGLVVIGVCTDGPDLEAERWELLDSKGVEFPIALDGEYAIQENWYYPVFPNFYLLTPGDKHITWFHEYYSEGDNAKLEEMVDELCNTGN